MIIGTREMTPSWAANPATSRAVSPGSTTPTMIAASAKASPPAITYSQAPTLSPIARRKSSTRSIVPAAAGTRTSTVPHPAVELVRGHGTRRGPLHAGDGLRRGRLGNVGRVVVVAPRRVAALVDPGRPQH